jgi:hypothetical protein
MVSVEIRRLHQQSIPELLNQWRERAPNQDPPLPKTLRGGMATSDEEKAIKAWTIKNAPGIPPRLSTCFAWHVTKEREQ